MFSMFFSPFLKAISHYCIEHPYYAQFLGSSRAMVTGRVSYEAKIAREIKSQFLLNEHGDLSFFFQHSFGEIIIPFEFNPFLPNVSG